MGRKIWAPILGAGVAVCVLLGGAVGAFGNTGSHAVTRQQVSHAATSPRVGSVAAASKITASDVKVAQSYTGGKTGKATGSPIDIGLIYPSIGDLGDAPLGAAVHSAVLFINNYLDGVDGHPITLVGCTFGATAQQGQECGEKFADNKAIKAVLYTVSSAGDTQLVAANGGRKVYFCVVSSPTDANVKNKFCTVGGPLATGAIPTYFADYLHAKTLSWLTLADPAISGVVSLVEPEFTKLGVKLKVGEEPDGVTDATSTVLAGGLASSDAGFVLSPTPATCIPFIKAINAISPHPPIVAFSPCQYALVNGKIANWTFVNFGPVDDPHEVGYGQWLVYNDATTAYQAQTGNAQNDGGTCQDFGEALLMKKILGEVGPNNLTTNAIAAKMKAYTGGLFCGDPHLKFGTQPYPSVGSVRFQFYTHHSNGTWSAAAGGAWLSSPK